MKTYTLYFVNTVSVAKEVEAENLSDAIDQVLNKGFPGLLFTDHTFPDVGDWEVDIKSAHRDYPGEEE